MATSYDLICPFLDGDPRYAFGVEFGMLYARMCDPDARVIDDFFTLANQDQILLAASRLGWHVEKIKPWDGVWFQCVMRREGA